MPKIFQIRIEGMVVGGDADTPRLETDANYSNEEDRLNPVPAKVFARRKKAPRQGRPTQYRGRDFTRESIP